ncbi:hypothetical protein CHRYSEOSP005_17740 [Chryseobacterium sp. Alg-005]|uniref:M4 family metallopeptidase n=1 Tax=Chryseobacterium sp. Alg-005 TaxID=3159516 RepID=UPI0035557405
MKKTITIVKALSFVFVVGASSLSVSHAQDRSRTEVSVKDLPKISVNSFVGSFHANFSGNNVSADFLASHLGEWLGTDSDHTFTFVKASTDELGIKHSTYQHYYKGIKVADEVILLHEKEGKLTFVNGELTPDINLSIKQPLTRTEVENIVSADMKAQNITFDDFDQVITKVIAGRKMSLHLTNQINALSLKSLHSYMYYVDNTTKQIVKKLEEIHHHNIPVSTTVAPLVDAPSTSATFYRGNQSVTVDSYNGTYRLKDNTRNIHTLNGTDWDGNGTVAGGLTGNITEYTNATANFTATETKPPVEVHWAMKTAYDYYINRHNRNSYDNNGSIIRNYYNINFAGSGQPENGVNAAAIDTQGIVAMVYGNGKYQGQAGYFNPFVALDVAGHEYSHLMVSRTANLAYQGESGALNESFADIFGASIEFYANLTPNWTIGEGIPNPALGFTYLRSMSNPNSGPAVLNSQQPDTYQGTYWANTAGPYSQANDFGGVHTNSGVGNYWFYLLSAGGSGTNDIGNAYSVTGITIQKAEKIAYRTLANYLTANSQFVDAYNLSKQAVTDLYGASSNEQIQNVKAWYAVGFGNGLLATNEAGNKLESQFSIYPNPAKGGVFTIENTKNDAVFEIYDVSGRLIRKEEKLNKGKNKITIDGVQKGIYLLKISSDGAAISKKIVVE